MFFRDQIDLSSDFSTFFYFNDGSAVWGGFPDGLKFQGRFEVSKVVSSLSHFQDVRVLSESNSEFFRGFRLFEVLVFF